MADIATSLLAVVRPLLCAHEGRRLHVYRDSLGVPTIGVGLALCSLIAGQMQPSVYARQLCQRCGADFDALLAGTADLTDAQCDQILSLCVIDAIEDLESIFPDFASFSVNRQAALVDMRFNLGGPRFREFHGMNSAISLGNWITASLEALDSQWARQVHTRALEDSELLAKG